MKHKILFIFILISSCFANAQINTNRVLDNGRNALYFEDYVLSIQYFNQVIALRPNLPEPYYFRAIAKIRLEDFVGAEADCSLALELNQFKPEILYARGFARKRLNKTAEALADFNKALEFDSQNADFLINRIEAYEKLEQYDKALTDIEFLLSKKSKISNMLQLEKCQILLQKKDSIAALETIQKAITKDSTYADFFGARAFIFLQKQDDKNALSDYNRAIALKTENIGSYINRGILNYRVKNYRGALADYNRAVELDSSNTQALFNRGLLRSEVGDLNNALADFGQLLELDNNNNDARYQRALTAMSLKEYKIALRDYKQLIEQYPHFAPAYFGKAEAHQGLGNNKQAAIDRYRGQQLMEMKPDKKAQKTEFNNKAQIVQTQTGIKDKTKDFENISDNSGNSSRYDDKIRGQIQNQQTDAKLKKNYNLNFYAPNDNLRKQNNYHPLIEALNQKQAAKILITNDEVPLTQNLIELHLKQIALLDEKIKASAQTDLLLERAINQAVLLNLNVAIEDLNKAIELDGKNALAYFCRANIRYKLLELELNQSKKEKEITPNADKIKQLLAQLILADYDKTIALRPDFRFAYLNRGNACFLVKNSTEAIQNYTQAIAAQKNFPEAYFNRGLVQLNTNEQEKAIADLSKAGELGIYQAYNLIKRFGVK